MRNKGGNVQGYSCLFSVVPEIETGVVMMWNGAADEFSFSNETWDLLLPALQQVLIDNKPVIPFPPNPNLYTGNYTVPGVTYAIIQVVQDPTNVLFLAIEGFGNFLLEYVDATDMRLYIPQGFYFFSTYFLFHF